MSDAAVTAEAVQPEVAAPVESVDQSAPPKEETTTAEPSKESEEKKEEQNGAEATEVKKDTSKPMLKTTGTIDRNARANLSKFDPNVLPETDDPVAIRAQV